MFSVIIKNWRWTLCHRGVVGDDSGDVREVYSEAAINVMLSPFAVVFGFGGKPRWYFSVGISA